MGMGGGMGMGMGGGKRMATSDLDLSRGSRASESSMARVPENTTPALGMILLGVGVLTVFLIVTVGLALRKYSKSQIGLADLDWDD